MADDEQPQQCAEVEVRLWADVFRHAAWGVTVSSEDGETFAMVNPAFARMHGSTVADLIGRPILEVYAPERRAEVAEQVRRTHERGHYAFESVHLRGDGSRFPVLVDFCLIKDELGRVLRRASIVQDLSEQKLLQKRLAQADRMATLGVLAAGLAHEINNPLTYVLYTNEHLTKGLPDVVDAIRRAWSLLAAEVGRDRAEALIGADALALDVDGALDKLIDSAGTATEGCRRMHDIVQDLKIFSRVGNDERRAVEIHPVIESAVNIAANEIKHRAQLVLQLEPTPPVLASEGRLSQVILNLLINAAQAIDEGDAASNSIRLRTWVADDEVCVEVSDTGHGIHPDQMSHLFDPFYSTKPRGIGSGLGLAVCQSIVTSLGGLIEVVSEVGAGTRFLVRLPAHHGAAQEDGATPPSGAAADPEPRGRVLVVDDDVHIRNVLDRILRQEHDVVVAPSAVDAMRVLGQDTAFDAILCDVMMPEVSGIDLLAWLERRDAGLASRVVFMTGGTFTTKATEFKRTTTNPQINKPFDTNLLLDLVRSLVKRARTG